MPASPPDPPDLVSLVAPFRYLVVFLAALWALRVARGRPVWALASGFAYAATAVGFWVLALGRPYGLLVDPPATRRAALMAVAAVSGRAEEGFLAGEPVVRGLWASLAAHGMPAGLLHW